MKINLNDKVALIDGLTKEGWQQVKEWYAQFPDNNVVKDIKKRQKHGR